MQLTKTRETIRQYEAYLKKLLSDGKSPEDAAALAYEKYPVMQTLEAEVEGQLQKEAARGYGQDLPDAVTKELTAAAWAADGLTLSERTTKAREAVTVQVVEAIQQALKRNDATKTAALALFDGYRYGGILPEQEIPAYLDKLVGLVGSNDRSFQSAMRSVERNLKKLNTRGMKAAYTLVKEAVEEANEKKLEKAIYTATQERTRYFAERIARTELARAYHDGFMAKWQDDDDCVAFKWKLSTRHPADDICDLYANADLYGLGKGVFPKDKVPTLPVHPHCMCRLAPVMRGELQGREHEQVEAGGRAYIRGISPTKRMHLLGRSGVKAVMRGQSWTGYARGYSAGVLRSRLSDWQKMNLNLMPADDDFLSYLAKGQKKAYTKGKVGNERFYADDGTPIYPPNDGAIGRIKNVTLAAGSQILSRYGANTGYYVSIQGTPIEARALPDIVGYTPELHEFVILKDITRVKCGRTAPWFGKPGLGVQYEMPVKISVLINDGYVREA